MQDQHHRHPEPEDEPIRLDPEQDEPIAAEIDEEEPLSLVGDEEVVRSSNVRAFGAGAVKHGRRGGQFRRQPQPEDSGAIRCRIFSSKIAHTSLEHMEQSINEWIDCDEAIRVKHVGHVVGTMTGKSNEPNLIVMVWY